MLQITLYIKSHKIVSVLVRHFHQNIVIWPINDHLNNHLHPVNCMLRSRNDHDIRFLDNMHIDIAVRLDQ